MDENHSICSRLGYEHPVKRIRMSPIEVTGNLGVVWRNGKR